MIPNYRSNFYDLSYGERRQFCEDYGLTFAGRCRAIGKAMRSAWRVMQEESTLLRAFARIIKEKGSPNV